MLESNLAFEFVLDDDFEFPTEQEEPSTWKISDEATADWAIRQIKAERARRDIYINAAKEHIASLNDKITHMQEQCDKKTAFLLSRLNDNLDVLPVKKTKTQVSFDLPSGKLVRKNSYQSFERDDAKLMEYVHCSSPELIKIKEEIDWSSLKKDLDIVNGIVVRKSTGEVVTGVSVIEKPETFDVK